MKKSSKKIAVAVMVTLLISSIIATGLGRHAKRVHPEPVKTTNIPETNPIPVYDPVLLKKFIGAVRALDFNQAHCTYSGRINMIDPNDTTNTMRDLHFFFCRSGNDYYYHLGSSEIIHEHNLNVYIQNDQHKVVLSRQQISIPPPVRNMDVIIKALQTENYVLISSVNKNKQTLKLLNEKHLSCKELTVTIDTITGKTERIFTRLNDFGNMMDKGKDRTIDVQISELSNRVSKEFLPLVSSVLKEDNSHWSLTGKYKNYELIRL